MLVGFVIAEERGFVSGIPIPALVLFRFLRHWGEINYSPAHSAPTQHGAAIVLNGGDASAEASFLVSYAVNSLKALLQSARMDNSVLSFCLANFAVLLHLFFKDKQYFLNQQEDVDEDEADDEDGLELGTVSSPSTRRVGGRKSIFLPRYDNIESISAYLMQEQDGLGVPPTATGGAQTGPTMMQQEEKEKEKGGEADKDRRKEEPNNKADQFSTSVLWFEQQVDILLGTTYAQLLHNVCNAQLKKTLELAIFSSKSSKKNPTPRTGAPAPAKGGGSGINSSTSSGNLEETNEHLEKIISVLTDYLSEMQSNFVYFGLINQFFQQIFRFIDSVLFNVLLLRKVCLHTPLPTRC